MIEFIFELIVWLAIVTTPADVWAAAEARFGDEAMHAVCIAEHETRLDRNVTGAQGERGIMQIHPVNWAVFHTNSELLVSPRESMRVAAELRRATGDWSPWRHAAALCGLQ